MVGSEHVLVLKCCEKFKYWTPQLDDEGNYLPCRFFNFIFREVPSRHSKPKSSVLKACDRNIDQGIRMAIHLFGKKKKRRLEAVVVAEEEN